MRSEVAVVFCDPCGRRLDRNGYGWRYTIGGRICRFCLGVRWLSDAGKGPFDCPECGAREPSKCSCLAPPIDDHCPHCGAPDASTCSPHCPTRGHDPLNPNDEPI